MLCFGANLLSKSKNECKKGANPVRAARKPFRISSKPPSKQSIKLISLMPTLALRPLAACSAPPTLRLNLFAFLLSLRIKRIETMPMHVLWTSKKPFSPPLWVFIQGW